ncbi:hypothetical protein [Maribacter luteus]|uniref:hypothetical protein n=1 Tax=Maribacter luteus TaxID=2594478 RepID=UPI0024922CDE|nr:hypothetical protein [Maribacter luteus]
MDFRPNKGYDGEYGFDFIRDKKVKNDKLTYKDILGTNYEYDKTKKKWVEKFKKYPDDKKYDSLKDDQYKTVTFPWYKDGNGKEIEYIQSWLTIYPNDSQKLSLQIETVENPKKLDLTLDYDKSFFKLNTDKVPAQSKGKKHLDDHLIIECLKEFSTDQTIKVMYKKEQLGQLNILKNDKASRKKVEVVFVEVKTHLNIKKSTKEGKSTGKKPFLKKYLKQALIKPTIVVTPLDLTTDKNFNKKFAGKGKGYIDERTGLHDYLNKKMDKKYKDFLKVYFIGDKCPTFNKAGTEDGRINGQAKDINSDAVVLFQGHNTSTTAHEALHALGLYHTFSPSKSHPYSYKKGETYNIMDYSHQSKYGSKKRILTWLWQWKKLWNNPLIKLE